MTAVMRKAIKQLMPYFENMEKSTENCFPVLLLKCHINDVCRK